MKQFSISQTLLALAIGYLAFSLIKVANEIPVLLEVLDKTAITMEKFSPQLPAVVTEIAKVRQLVEQQLPNVLSEVNAIQPIIKDVITESQNYSQHIPAIVKQLDKIEQQVNTLMTQMPSILQRVDAVVLTVNTTTEEVAKWRPHSSAYLKQIEYSRQEIPQYLTRVETIIVDAKNIGSEASSGLVSGLFKGVVSLPFNLLSGLTGIVSTDSRSAKFLNSKDIELMKKQTIVLLNNSQIQEMKWQNKSSGNHGDIDKGASFIRKGKKCHQLTFINYFNDQKEKLTETMCLNGENVWDVL